MWTAGTLLLNTLVLVPLVVSASPAIAGWYAKQRHTATNGNSRETELYYDSHHIRIDASGDPSVIIKLPTGAFTMLDHDRKVYARATLEELLALRKEMKTKMAKQIESMPPEIQERFATMLKKQEEQEKAGVTVKKTGRRSKVLGVGCVVYTWTGPDGDNEACLAKKTPVDTGSFRKDAIALGEKLKNLGTGPGAASVELLQLAEHGFPMKMTKLVSLGPKKLETTTEVVELKPLAVNRKRFDAPAGYRQMTLEQMAILGPNPGSSPPGQ